MTVSLSAPSSPSTYRPPTARRSLAVYKFGGAALADERGLRRAAELVAQRRPEPTVVVASALFGVTDSLLEIARRAVSGEDVTSEVAALRERHLSAIDGVATAESASIARAAVYDAFDELHAIASVAGQTTDLCARTRDLIVARGERLAAEILVAALDAAGVAASTVDATRVILTDGRHGHAAPDIALTRRAARAVLGSLIASGVTPVIPGFIGRGADNSVVTLGRGGSDLTATIIARALGARQTVLWKDVPGVLTADPRAVPDARLVPELTAREAAALAAYGAKVLHPRALVPLTTRTRLTVRSFSDTDRHGTTISAAARVRHPIKTIAASADQALLTLAGDGFATIADLTTQAHAALIDVGLARAILGHAASEDAITITVDDGNADAALAALRCAFTRVSVRRPVTTIGIVGSGLATQPRLATRVFASLAAAGIEVVAGAQRPSDAALSIIVDRARSAEAQRVLHDEFQLGKTGGGQAVASGRTDVVLLGVGAIGRELLTQLSASPSRAAAVRVCALIDSSGYLFDPRGLARARLVEAVAAKRAKRPLATLRSGQRGTAADAIAEIGNHALSSPVLIDATAADTRSLLDAALARGWDVVLANKVPLAGNQEAFDALQCSASSRRCTILHEATVGAGLPVIDTLRKLQEAGDRVLRIEGCPSGTLGFLFGELGRGRRFSDALRAARAAGYTEPDPRIDLSGADVARKALILARLIGFRGSVSDTRVESLIPERLRDIPLAEFLERLEELDEPWANRVGAVRDRGKVLRYRARVTRRSIEVGLVAVGPTDTLGALDGTDNQFAFTTTRYRAQPLVITGPGAGPAVTAAGVYNDLLRLVAERRGGR